MPAFAVPANLAFDSYTALIAAVSDWMDRDDLTGSAPQMIALAEAKMARELEPMFSEKSGSVVSVAGATSLPADCGIMRTAVYNSRVVPQIAPSQGVIIAQGSSPLAYSLEANLIKFWPAGAYTVSILYQPRLPKLSNANATNDLLQQHPDLYFFGAMMFAEGYEANDSRAALFSTLFDRAIESTRQYLTRQRYSGPMVPRVAVYP